MVTFKDIGDPKTCGWLGNNLFELLAAYNVAVKNGDELFLPPFQYDNIFKNNFFKTLPKEDILIESEYFEPSFRYQNISYTPHMNLNGYFQSPKYFEGLDVRNLLKPKLEIKNEILNTVNKQLDKTYEEILAYHRVTSIHIRRGDFLNFSHVFENLMNTDYYQKAIEKLRSVTDYFLIFSNDIPYCKEIFKGEEFIFSDSEQEKSQGNKSSVHDLYLGSYCKNNIIANSSFSWWQGYLNDSPYKKVIYPSKWFVNNIHDISDLFPSDKNWILI